MGKAFDPILKFFGVVEIREVDIERSKAEISETVANLSCRRGSKWPWQNHYTWKSRYSGFRVVGRQEFREIRIDGSFEEKGDHTHVSLRHSCDEPVANSALFFPPVLIALVLFLRFSPQRGSVEISIQELVRESVIFFGLGGAVIAVFLAILGVNASQQRSEDLSMVVSELHG